MNDVQLKKLADQLYSTSPLIGRLLRRRAVRKLAGDGSWKAIRTLAEAVTRSDDAQVRSLSLDAFRQLSNQDCIDAVCDVWASTRDDKLAKLLIDCKWVADSPANVRVLSALKVGRLEVVTESERRIIKTGKGVIKLVLQACNDTDEEIVQQAQIALRNLNHVETQEELCRLLVEYEHPIAQQIAIEKRFAPRTALNVRCFSF
jgi:hypothetical protein